MEKWIKITGYPHYEVSSLGRVRSLDRKIQYIQKNQYGENLSTKILKGKILKSRKTRSGYNRVKMNNIDFYIHRLVAMMFIGDITNKEINHLDGNKDNNEVSNLEIVDRIANQNHAVDTLLNNTVDKAISVIVNGNLYNSLGEASRGENIPKGVLSERIKNPNPKKSGNFKYIFTLEVI